VLWAAGRLALVALACLFAVLLAGIIIVGRHGGGPVQGWDNSVERWFPQHRGPLVPISKLAATYLDAGPLAVICTVLSVVLACTLRSIRALLPIVAYLGAEVEVFVVRHVVLRHRPRSANYPAPHAVRGVHETSCSFPSGHAAAVTAVLFALLGSIALNYRFWWPWLVALAASLFVIDTRLVLGVHWFSDVTAGLLFGMAWGIALAIVARQVEWADLVAIVRPGPGGISHLGQRVASPAGESPMNDEGKAEALPSRR
jgi:membrane-associated phospholipid phosphatase